MEEVFLITKDCKIFDSLDELGRTSKKFKIRNKSNKFKNLNNKDIYIVDDSILNPEEDFDFLKENKSNFIILRNKTKTEKIKRQDIKIFYKPLKVFELYNEIISKIETRVLRSNNWRLEKKRLVLISKKEEIIKFTEKEVILLDILMQKPKDVFSKESLLFKVWGIDLNKNKKIETRVLETSVSRIRKKLLAYNDAPKIIKNKKGYKLFC